MRKILLTVLVCLASWYSSKDACQYNPNPKCPTASGQSLYTLERDGAEYAASWDYPFGTKLEVTNTKNGKKTIVIVCDRGPSKKLGRSIDISKKSAEKIGMLKDGITEVKIREIKP